MPVVVIEQERPRPSPADPPESVAPVWSCPTLWFGVAAMAVALLAVLLSGGDSAKWEVGACIDGSSDASVAPVDCTARHIGAIIAVVPVRDACPRPSEGIVTVEPGRHACVVLRGEVDGRPATLS